MSILEAHSGPIKGVHFEARSGDPSTVAVASTLASLSNLKKELSLLPPSVHNNKDVKQAAEMSILPAASGVLDKHDAVADMKDASDHNDVSLVDKTGTITPDYANDNLNLENGALDCVDAEIGKATGASGDLRPLLQMFAGSPVPEFDLRNSINRILEEQRGMRETKDFDPPVLISARRQAFKDGLQQAVLDSKNIEVSFENFPYYLR